ncbi:hypothetical protein [Pontibacter flavimaris]|uniref:Uncharacterized protein n=1 Tax=Pontibacter flavimaris TaxID=1797110 RepID=A0A1Q5PAH2_9BACT|nr:hypothetical protein [Pontibacter flavimaris]OKL39204.1 hypothetical protein A3841_04480 [Pontibacter flavimaris]
MLNYEKLSRSTRTRTAMLLLLLFMVLAVADLFISFFGGVVLGLLLVQFEMEVQRFFRHSAGRSPSVARLLKAYADLGLERKLQLKAGLQVLVFILILADVLDSFWGGMISGVLLALLADDLIRYQRRKRKITIKKN